MCMALPAMIKMEQQPLYLVLIISPLRALMDDHIKTCMNWGLSAVKLQPLSEMEEDIINGIREGRYTFVFASPESALKPFWKNMFLRDVWQTNAILLCIDEAHCISEWGEEFRKEYQLPSELRSVISVPIMALTATSTPKVKDDIFRYLQLPDDTTLFLNHPTENIFLCFEKSVEKELCDKLQWFIDHLKQYGGVSKKTIIYCRSIDKVSEVFISIKEILGIHAYADKIKDSEHLLVEMYHKCTDDDSKERILTNFKNPNANLRCIVATIALGMGVLIPDVDLVVHIGCPKSVISYWQEAGQCSRDGRQGFSYVIYDNFTMSQKNTEKDIADIMRNEENKCHRLQILQAFNISNDPVILSNSVLSVKGVNLEFVNVSHVYAVLLVVNYVRVMYVRSLMLSNFWI